jgi:hypothetical protein
MFNRSAVKAKLTLSCLFGALIFNMPHLVHRNLVERAGIACCLRALVAIAGTEVTGVGGEVIRPRTSQVDRCVRISASFILSMVTYHNVV